MIRKFRKLSMQAKLYFSNGLLGLAIVVLALLGVVSLVSVKNIVHNANKFNSKNSKLILTAEMQTESISSKYALLTSSDVDVMKLVNELNEEVKEAKVMFDELISANKDTQWFVVSMKEQRHEFDKFDTAGRETIKLFLTGDREAGVKSLDQVIEQKDAIIKKFQRALNNMAEHSESKLSSTLNWFIGIFIGLSLIFLIGPGIITYITLMGAKNQLEGFANSLSNLIGKNEQSVGMLSSSSNQLSNSASEQDSSLQESLSALHEIASMLDQTNSHVSDCRNMSVETLDSTQIGGTSMRQMTGAMRELEESQNQLSELTELVENISKKTDVINDIVFKTQLLAFNASIEAAKAGRHGRGFAVVAEEVGKLADMSGEAADDIDSLLNKAHGQVELVVKEMSDRVAAGIERSDQAAENFNKIDSNIKTIDDKLNSIGNASLEQQSATRETLEAISGLTDLASENSRSATLIKDLSEEGLKLNSGLQSLCVQIQMMVGMVNSEGEFIKKAALSGKSHSAASSKENQAA